MRAGGVEPNGQSAPLSLVGLEQYLAKVADLLRGSIDQANFKANIFPLMFYKRISKVDEVVMAALFEGWQNTRDGDRLVLAMRKTLYIKLKIRDNDAYERALGHIREYY